jgi:hypothetical protein
MLAGFSQKKLCTGFFQVSWSRSKLWAGNAGKLIIFGSIPYLSYSYSLNYFI